jgi:hypothetical protein
MNVCHLLSAMLVATVMLAGDCLQADLVIDSFTAGSRLTLTAPGTVSRTTTNYGILGGVRDASLTLPDLGGLELFGSLAFGRGLQMDQGPSDQIRGSLVYDNFSSVDLTDAGLNTNFAIRVSTSNSPLPVFGALQLSVQSGQTDASADPSSSTVTFDIPAGNEVPAWIIVNFSEFSGVDFTDVNSIQLDYDFQGYPGTVLSFNSFISTAGIPEPQVARWMWPGIGMLLVGRRRQTATVRA